jgi:Rrf2 family protein
MAANNRFSFSVHIMTMLAYLENEGATSQILARSLCTNPVVVRRLLSQLHQGGLIHCQSGKSGGCRLARAPGDITLHDIYEAVEAGGPFVIPQKPENKNCMVSCQMKEILEDIFKETQQAIAQRLKRMTVADLLKTVNAAA